MTDPIDVVAQAMKGAGMKSAGGVQKSATTVVQALRDAGLIGVTPGYVAPPLPPFAEEGPICAVRPAPRDTNLRDAADVVAEMTGPDGGRRA